MKLATHPLFFLDLQTTGPKPSSGHILEIAWSSPNSPPTALLVQQPEGVSIPRRIQMVTGIKEAHMEEALPFLEVLTRLKDFIHSPPLHHAFCIIHFAQFEKPFLQEAFGEDLPFSIICTHEIAKRLYPNMPSRGIKGLAGFFGNNTGEFKRALGHVEATKMIWENLLPALAEKNIHTFNELEHWLKETSPSPRTQYAYPLPKEKRLSLPETPGIYRMLNLKGEVLYVGKATSLRDRVNSYFRGQKKRDAKKLEMLAQVYDLHVTECESPLEAALMETDEIKRLNPYYNIALKVGLRNLVFFNRDFTSMAESWNEEHCQGPFSSPLIFQPMMSLISFMNNKEVLPLPPEDLFYDILDPELILAGLHLLCSRHHLKLDDLSSMRKIMALGMIWEHRLSHQEEKEISVDEGEDENEEEQMERAKLTPEDIADKFERHFRRVGRSYMRAKKLNQILNAEIEFAEKNGEKKNLVISNGQISTTLPPKNPWAPHPIHTYDRMTVLITELERIKWQKGKVKINFKSVKVAP